METNARSHSASESHVKDFGLHSKRAGRLFEEFKVSR